MPDERSIHEWRKRYRESVRFLPVALTMLVVLAAGLVALSFFVVVPLWAVIGVLGVSTFTVVGDVVNIIYLGRKLRDVDTSGEARS